MWRSLRRKMSENLGIKIASLALALLVYAHVYSQEEQIAVLQVPVSIEGLPRGLTYRGEIPPSVHVRIQARGGELLKLRAQPPRAVIHLTDPRPGQLQRPVTAGDVVLPPESDARVEAVLDPVVLSLNIEPITTKDLPVAVRVKGVPADGFLLYGLTRAWPETLAVNGPAGLLAGVDSIPTEEIDLHDRSETFGGTVRLELPRGLSSRTERVSVRIPIAQFVERTYGPLRVALPPLLRGAWKAEPESVRVRLAGPRPVVEPVSPSELHPRVAPSIPPGAEEVVPVEVALAPALRGHLQVEAVDPPTVSLVRRGR